MNYSEWSDVQIKAEIFRRQCVAARYYLINKDYGWYERKINGRTEIARLCEAPNYPEDISAALKLVEQAEQVNVGFSLNNVKTVSTQRINYEAVFYDPWGGPMCREYTAEARTAARAISGAWLMLTGPHDRSNPCPFDDSPTEAVECCAGWFVRSSQFPACVHMSDIFSTREEALADWNKRPREERLLALLKQAREALEFGMYQHAEPDERTGQPVKCGCEYCQKADIALAAIDAEFPASET